MQQYRVYVNGQHARSLSTKEYETIRKRVSKHIGVRLEACGAILGALFNGVTLLVNNIATTGGLLFLAAVLFAPLYWTDATTAADLKNLPAALGAIGKIAAMLAGVVTLFQVFALGEHSVSQALQKHTHNQIVDFIRIVYKIDEHASVLVVPTDEPAGETK